MNLPLPQTIFGVRETSGSPQSTGCCDYCGSKKSLSIQKKSCLTQVSHFQSPFSLNCSSDAKYRQELLSSGRGFQSFRLLVHKSISTNFTFAVRRVGNPDAPGRTQERGMGMPQSGLNQDKPAQVYPTASTGWGKNRKLFKSPCHRKGNVLPSVLGTKGLHSLRSSSSTFGVTSRVVVKL